MDRELIVGLLAEGLSVEAIGKRVGKHPSTVSYWMDKYGLEAPNREKHAAKGGIERGRLEELVAAGSTIAEIAVAVGRSKSTVRHWLGEFGLKTIAARRRAQPELGEDRVESQCAKHGVTAFVGRPGGGWRCARCRVEQVTRWRRKVKELLVEEAGGCCQLCGYRRCVGALEFHHLDPAAKRFQIGGRGLGRSLERLREEARKCVLLCSNCHVEVEAGLRVVPLQFGIGEANE